MFALWPETTGLQAVADRRFLSYTAATRPKRCALAASFGDMGFHVTHRQGASLADPDEATIDAVLDELDRPDDPEHPDVSLTHESEWSLSAFKNGLLVWENLEDDGSPARHMTGVPRSEVQRLWQALARGDIQVVEAENWQPGYG